MAKAGRRRKAGVKRYPGGQIVQDTEEEKAKEARATVINARRRFYGLGKEPAQSELAGYVIGRMALDGCFGKDYQPSITAVADYCQTVAEFHRLKLPMSPIPKAMNYFAARGASLNSDPSRQQVEKVEKRYLALCKRMQEADGIDRMHFHNAAFHDMEQGIYARQGIVRCVSLLKA